MQKLIFVECSTLLRVPNVMSIFSTVHFKSEVQFASIKMNSDPIHLNVRCSHGHP